MLVLIFGSRLVARSEIREGPAAARIRQSPSASLSHQRHGQAAHARLKICLGRFGVFRCVFRSQGPFCPKTQYPTGHTKTSSAATLTTCPHILMHMDGNPVIELRSALSMSRKLVTRLNGLLQIMKSEQNRTPKSARQRARSKGGNAIIWDAAKSLPQILRYP